MNLALTKVTYNQRLSEETPAYGAVVTLDGKPFCEVLNRGHGGCDEQRMIAPFTHEDLKRVSKSLEAQYGTFETFDAFCHDRLYAHLDDKVRNKQEAQLARIKSEFASKVFFLKRRGSKSIYSMPIGKLADLKRAQPKAVIINELPDGELRAIFCS